MGNQHATGLRYIDVTRLCVSTAAINQKNQRGVAHPRLNRLDASFRADRDWSAAASRQLRQPQYFAWTEHPGLFHNAISILAVTPSLADWSGSLPPFGVLAKLAVGDAFLGITHLGQYRDVDHALPQDDEWA